MVEQKGFEPSTPKLRRCFRCPTPKLPDGCVSRETLARNSRSVEHEIGKPQGRRRPKAIGPPRVWPLPLRCCGTRDRLSRLLAWHDHSAASRRAHGAAYATYIGCWRNHARVAQGQRSIARFEDAKTGSTRSFCSRCKGDAPLPLLRLAWIGQRVGTRRAARVARICTEEGCTQGCGI